jgi:hypothetical protein
MMSLKSPTITRALLVAAALFLVWGTVYAWIRLPRSDAEVVARAELIVIAAVKEGSVSCALPPLAGGLPENHLELEVSEFLKGTNVSRTIPVCLPWGLVPLVGGYYSNRWQMVNLRVWAVANTNYPQEVIEIYDSGNSAVSMVAFTGDIRTNHIWVLRHEPSYTYNCRSNLISVYDPQDIQPLSKRVDLEKYLK